MAITILLNKWAFLPAPPNFHNFVFTFPCRLHFTHLPAPIFSFILHPLSLLISFSRARVPPRQEPPLCAFQSVRRRSGCDDYTTTSNLQPPTFSNLTTTLWLQTWNPLSIYLSIKPHSRFWSPGETLHTPLIFGRMHLNPDS